MSLVARLAVGVVLGICLAVVGNIAGWFAAFSVPERLIVVPFMPLLTGVGAGLGGYIGWRIDLDGNSSGLMALMLPLALLCGLLGAWLGFQYGASDEGTRVWRYPVTQATVLGAVAGANVGLLAYNAIRMLLGRRRPAPSQSPEYFQALKAMRAGAAKTPEQTKRSG